MIVDTEKKVFLTHLRRLVILLVFGIGVLLVILLSKMPNTWLGLNKYQWALAMCAVFVLYAIAEGVLQLNYIYFSDEGDKITLRYFSLGYFNSRKNLIEMPKAEFVSYSIEKKIWGMKTKITLHRHIRNKEAKYPPVCLSLLSQEEIKKITTTLNRYNKS